MIKRMISLISASLLMVGLLAGCGNEKEPSQPSAEQAQPQQTEEAQPSTEQPQAQAGIFQTMQMTDFDGNEVDKSLFEGHRFPEGKLNEDFRLLVELLCEGERVRILPEQLYHVFYRIGSNTRRKDKNDFSRVFEDIVENADYMEQLTRERYPELREYAVRFALVQRLDYLLHIPVGRMVDTDVFYKSVKQYLRGHFSDTRKNPLLDKKSRTYLTLLTIAPKTVRRVHGWTMKLRGVE